MNDDFRTSPSGARNIIDEEGEKLTAYQDSGGLWTVGVGHTGHEVKQGFHITAEQSRAYLAEDLIESENIIKACVMVPLNQNQFDALVSFVFNVGEGRPAKGKDRGRAGFRYLRNGNPSSALRLLNHSDYEGCADAMLVWKYAGGVVAPGLLTRRERERTLFLS